MFTPQQASEMLKIPPSTLRRYANQFGSHLSESARQERSRRYTESDITTLARARELLASGNNPQKANELLSVVSDDKQADPESALAMIPTISQALTEALDTSRALRAQFEQLTERQDSTEQALAAALARLDALERQSATPWYKRILKRDASKAV